MTPATQLTTMLSHALAYAARGWAVFPLHDLSSGSCSCGAAQCAAGKHPRTLRGVLDATTDTAQITQWWRAWPTAGIGVATGAASGIIVVDVDPRNGGEAPSWLTPTLTALTGGGGQHYIYAGSGKYQSRICDGVDLKSDGGYIVVAPTLHASGRHYDWDAGQPDDPEPAPPELSRYVASESAAFAGDPNAEVTRSRLFLALQAAGMVRGMAGHGRVAVRCPWEHEHSEPGSPSSTVVLASGGWRCMHAHCSSRTTADVWRWLESALPHCIPPEPEPDISRIRGTAAPSVDIDIPEPSPRQYDSCLSRDQHGRLVATAGNVAILLAHHPAVHLALDTLSGTIRWARSGPPVAGYTAPRAADPIADWHAAYLAQWVLADHGVVVGIDTMHHAIEAAAAQAGYDPLVQYLSALTWDGTRRIDTWLTTYLGAEDSAAARLSGRLWLISAAARGLDHGCQADHVLVLEGMRQGEGKSRALRILGGDYYGTLPSLDEYHRAADVIRGRWIVEIGELDAIRGRSASKVKDFLTQPSDIFRPAYARTKICAPRACVYAGTTNESHYLDDPTGARRYWPVLVRRLDDQALQRDRDQLIAEAVHEYRAGSQWWPTTDDECATLRHSASDRQEEDVWTEQVLRAAAAAERSTCDILVAAVGLEPARQTRKEASRVAGILRFHGYSLVRRRAGSEQSRPRTWVKTVP